MGTVEPDTAQARIRRLNNQFRCHGSGRGSMVVTAGIHDKGQAFMDAAIATTRSFDRFTKDNDPHGEHDFGAFTIEDERLFWKLDYYDCALAGHSPDAADSAVTHRVLTIMLASEY